MSKQGLRTRHMTKFHFAMATSAKRDQIGQSISCLPVTVKGSIGFDVVDAQVPFTLAPFRSAYRAPISVALHGGAFLSAPIRSAVKNRAAAIVHVARTTLGDASSLVSAFLRATLGMAYQVVTGQNLEASTAYHATLCQPLRTGMRLCLSRAKFRATLCGAKSTRSTVVRLERLSTPFAHTYLALGAWRVWAILKGTFSRAVFAAWMFVVGERSAATGTDSFHSILVNAHSQEVGSQGGTSAAFSLIRLGYRPIIPQNGAESE